MKGKFNSIWRVAVALVLVLSFSLVMAVPVGASPNVENVTVEVVPNIATAEAEYTISFKVNIGLAADANSIIITFPDDTIVPLDADFDDTQVSVDTAACSDGDVTVDGQVVTIITPIDVEYLATCVVVFAGPASAGIINPPEGDYTLWLHTDVEAPDVESAPYAITGPVGPVDVYDASVPMGFQASYDTITDALDHPGITTGWTVKVHADGGYDSSLETYPIDIDVVGVTVESLDGAASTTIDASDWSPTLTDRPAAVVLKADDVTFGGEDVGFTVIAADDAHPGVAPESYGVEIWLDVDRATVEDNIITGLDESPQVGIHIWPGEHGNTDITIKDNTLTTTFTTEADWAKMSAGIVSLALGGSNVLIDGNTVTGFSVGMNLTGLVGTDDTKPVVISNNTVNDSAFNGIEVTGNYVAITGNQVFGNGGNGLAIVATNTKVFLNDIYGNGNGVKVYSTIDAATVAVSFNDIYENINTLPEDLAELLGGDYELRGAYENLGVLNHHTNELNATRNFWGDLSGPSAAPDVIPATALGSGDAVSAVVAYEPWLTYTFVDVVDESVQWYGGAYYVTLGAGWNTLATPVPLDARADQMSEILALGDWMQNYLIGYTYDPVNSWQLIQGAYDPALVPCSAIYVKMSATDTMPCLKNGVFYMPTLDLPEGYNLVSLNYDDTMPVDKALKSIETTPGLGGYSQVISPPLPNQASFVWSAGATPIPHLSPGWGYWVYMTGGDETLAGFLMTPQYLTEEELLFLACTDWSLTAFSTKEFPIIHFIHLDG